MRLPIARPQCFCGWLPAFPRRRGLAPVRLSFVELSNTSESRAPRARELAYSDSCRLATRPDSTGLLGRLGYVRIALVTRRFAAARLGTVAVLQRVGTRGVPRRRGAGGTEDHFALRLVGTAEILLRVLRRLGCSPVVGITVDAAPLEHLEMIAIEPPSTSCCLRPVWR